MKRIYKKGMGESQLLAMSVMILILVVVIWLMMKFIKAIICASG